jgi:phosphoserine phosphatase RsbU/P
MARNLRAALVPSTKDEQDTNAILAELADIAAENALSVDRLLAAVARPFSKIVDCELFAVLLRVKDAPYLQVTYTSGRGGGRAKSRRVRIGRGITGAAAASRKTIVVNDVRRDPRYIAAIDDVRAEMAVPLIACGRLIGVIDLGSTRDNVFGHRERALLRLVSPRIALALHNARLHGETASWNRTLATLVRLSHESSSLLSLKHLLQNAASLTRRLVHYDAFSVSLVDWEAQVLRSYFGVRHDERISLDNIPLDKGIVGAAARTGFPVLVRDRRERAAYRAQPDSRDISKRSNHVGHSGVQDDRTCGCAEDERGPETLRRN